MTYRIDSSQLQLPGFSLASGVTDYVDSVYDLSADDVERLKAMKPKKLGIVCGRSECKKKLHSFRPPLSRAHIPSSGCQVCGIEAVSWNLMQARNLGEINLKFEFLKTEWIRHFFFNLQIPPRLREFSESCGLGGLEQVAQDQLSDVKMVIFNPALDWKQTKMLNGNIVHWARHAVGCCCRRCLAYWHNVPLNATLTSSDIDYFRRMIMAYVMLRLPILSGSANAIAPTAVSVDHVRRAM